MNNEIPECKRCGHQWFSRSLGLPAKCPKCQSRKWNESQKKPSLISGSVFSDEHWEKFGKQKGLDKPDPRTRKQLDDLNAMKFGKIRG